MLQSNLRRIKTPQIVLNDSFFLLNWVLLVVTVITIYFLLYNSKKPILKKTKFLVIIIHIFIFIIIPRVSFSEANAVIWNFKYGSILFFLITNTITYFVFKHVCIKTILQDKYYEDFARKQKLTLHRIYRSIEYPFYHLFSITLFFFYRNFFSEDLNWFYLFLMMLWYIITVSLITYYEAYLFFIEFSLNYNDLEFNEITLFNFKITRNTFHFLWLFITVFLNIFSLIHPVTVIF